VACLHSRQLFEGYRALFLGFEVVPAPLLGQLGWGQMPNEIDPSLHPLLLALQLASKIRFVSNSRPRSPKVGRPRDCAGRSSCSARASSC
jgi:hypothetical protein